MASVLGEPQASEPLRVVIADDHAVYREGLARMLHENGIEVVAEAADGEAAVRAVDEVAPDVVLVDLRMPAVGGLEATRRLAERAEPTSVLVLSVSAEESDVTDAITAGASGYVLKDEPVEEVIAGIRAAASGAARLSPRVASVLRQHVHRAIGSGEALAGGGLSARELQVLDLLALGKADDQISEDLSISARSVGDYVRSILTKLHVESRVRSAQRGDDG